MRLAALLALSALLVAGCGGSSADSEQEHPSFAGVRRAHQGGRPGAVPDVDRHQRRRHEDHRRGERDHSFAQRRAHLYKQLPGGQFPQELVVIGPYTYTNANVQAALNDPSVPPWTKLDTRRLTPKQRRDQPDELAHVQAPVYLPAGVSAATYGGKERDGTFRFSGRVDPKRLAGSAPASIRTALANDYPAEPSRRRSGSTTRAASGACSSRYATPQRHEADARHDLLGLRHEGRPDAAGRRARSRTSPLRGLIWNARAPVAGDSDTAHLARVALERRHRYALRPTRTTCLV